MPANHQVGHSEEEIYGKLMQLDFTGSTFPDLETLNTLDIRREVQDMLGQMMISNIVNHNHEAYREETCMFLASLRVIYRFDSEDVDDPFGGFITFKTLDGETKRVDFGDLWEIYGFMAMKYHSNNFEIAEEEVEFVWNEIAADTFQEGETKSSSIRHPAIRYVQKILAHSFYARKDTDKVEKQELRFLRIGVARRLRNSLRNQCLFPNLSQHQPCSLKLFLEGLLGYKNKALDAEGPDGPELSIGGWITPIFRRLRIRPRGRTYPSKLMNMDYLVEKRFIIGSLDSRLCYLYELEYQRQAILLLPDRRRVAFDQGHNLGFRHDFYDLRNIISHMTPMGSAIDSFSNLHLGD